MPPAGHLLQRQRPDAGHVQMCPHCKQGVLSMLSTVVWKTRVWIGLVMVSYCGLASTPLYAVHSPLKLISTHFLRTPCSVDTRSILLSWHCTITSSLYTLVGYEEDSQVLPHLLDWSPCSTAGGITCTALGCKSLCH